MSGSAFAVTHHAFSSGAGRTSDGNGSHASTLKSPSYTKSVSWQHYPAPAPAPAPATILRTTERRESIGGKIAELELRLREDKRNEIVEKILQKNAVKQQKHLRLIGWLPFLRRFTELLRSYGKSILHKPLPGFSKLYATGPLRKGKKFIYRQQVTAYP